MAFGIDDFLGTAAAGINLSDTLVRIVLSYAKNDKLGAGDLEKLFAEVKATAIENINEAQSALYKFERTLVERKVDINRPLHDVIRDTPFWKPFESFRLSTSKRSFDHLSENVSRSCDDIAALLRCAGKEQAMGGAVVESSQVKREFNNQLLHASSASLKKAIELIRDQLDHQKYSLTNS